MIKHLICWLKLWDLGHELGELLEYRRALVDTIRSAPSELQAINQKIADVQMELNRLRATIGSPNQQENDHAADTRKVGQVQGEEHPHGNTPRQIAEAGRCNCVQHSAQGKQRP